MTPKAKAAARKGTRPAQGSMGKQTAIRLPAELLERVAAHADSMRAEHPGMRVTVADAMRTLLLLGLDQAGKGRR